MGIFDMIWGSKNVADSLILDNPSGVPRYMPSPMGGFPGTGPALTPNSGMGYTGAGPAVDFGAMPTLGGMPKAGPIKTGTPLNYGAMSDPYAAQKPRITTNTPLNMGAFPDPYGSVNVPNPVVPDVSPPTPNPMLPQFGGDVLSGLLSDAGVTGVTAPSPMAGIPAVAGAAAAPMQGNWLSNTFGNGEGGLDLDKLGTAFDGLKSVFGIWGGMKQLGMAKDAYEFEKKSYQENVANQKKTYNSTLEDRQRARAAFAGEDEKSVDDYVKKHRL